MVFMTLRLTVRPEMTAHVINIVKSLMGPVSAEPDCHHFGFYSDITNDDKLMLFVEWASQEALNDHIQSDDFRKLLEAVEMSELTPEIKFITVSHIAGIELIKKLRG